MRVKFGTAGCPDEFYALGYKSTIQVPAYLNEIGLTAFEYQCGYGVSVGEKTAKTLGEEAEKHGITVSLHAPYYISLSSPEREKQEKAVNYLLESARALTFMGGTRVVLHCGGAAGVDRGEAFERAMQTLTLARQTLDDAGYSHIVLCPETMGKLNQLGTLEEVLTLCSISDRMLPCIDFGHLYARSCGELKTGEDFDRICQQTADALGAERASAFHAHFSKIEYTSKGEKRHLDFNNETGFGPDFAPLAKVIHARNLAPTIICESKSMRAVDALAMKNELTALYF